MKVKTLALLSLFTGLALIMSYIEALMPIPLPVPGIKVGFPNIIILFILYRFGTKCAVAVSLVRVLLVSLLFGSALGLAYSLAGAVLSLAVMIILKKTNKFSPMGISICGAIAHNIGQIAVAIVILEEFKIALYLPILLISGAITGAIIGILSIILLKAPIFKKQPHI